MAKKDNSYQAIFADKKAKNIKGQTMMNSQRKVQTRRVSSRGK